MKGEPHLMFDTVTDSKERVSHMSEGPQMPAMPLSMRRAGETVKVAHVTGNEEMKHHLQNLGFVEGNEVHVVSTSAGNLIVTVLDARFGLDTKVAQHVMTA